MHYTDLMAWDLNMGTSFLHQDPEGILEEFHHRIYI